MSFIVNIITVVLKYIVMYKVIQQLVNENVLSMYAIIYYYYLVHKQWRRTQYLSMATDLKQEVGGYPEQLFPSSVKYNVFYTYFNLSY